MEALPKGIEPGSLLSLMSSFGRLRTGFEAVGREIPMAQQLKGGWLDKIHLFPAKFPVKVTLQGFLPSVEMTYLSSYEPGL
jgi:hypothetical protein